MTLLDEQVDEIKKIFSDVSVQTFGDGTSHIFIPSLKLPAGWNQVETSVSFLVPVGYPMAKPDCFWTDINLRLANGATPQNTGINPMPNVAEQKLWFSWHLEKWNPSTDTLMTFLRVIQNRFSRAI